MKTREYGNKRAARTRSAGRSKKETLRKMKDQPEESAKQPGMEHPGRSQQARRHAPRMEHQGRGQEARGWTPGLDHLEARGANKRHQPVLDHPKRPTLLEGGTPGLQHP